VTLLPGPATLLTKFTWAAADALPFPLCLSSVTDASHGSRPLTADQGVWTIGESLGVVPAAPVAPVTGIGCNCSTAPGAPVTRPRYEPTLANQPFTFAVSYDDTAPASTFLTPPAALAQPQVTLAGDDGVTWTPVGDLLEQNDTFHGFIAEIEWDGTAHLRFGDGVYGATVGGVIGALVGMGNLPWSCDNPRAAIPQ
jgi:hypothetical protein